MTVLALPGFQLSARIPSARAERSTPRHAANPTRPWTRSVDRLLSAETRLVRVLRRVQRAAHAARRAAFPALAFVTAAVWLTVAEALIYGGAG